ncbi:hypothetical protein, partial [Methanobacterium sp. 42_16]|uniref:hypothetical protein n=1 Tax=Methanobacterium sp. 42_16 TaxID=1641383 RepID=UPI00257D2B0A
TSGLEYPGPSTSRYNVGYEPSVRGSSPFTFFHPHPFTLIIYLAYFCIIFMGYSPLKMWGNSSKQGYKPVRNKIEPDP